MQFIKNKRVNKAKCMFQIYALHINKKSKPARIINFSY